MAAKRKRALEGLMGHKLKPGWSRRKRTFRRPTPRFTGELKFHDIAVDNGGIATAGAIANAGTLNIIAQGVLESQRIGRKCTIRKINWRYNLQLPSSASASETSDVARVILYVDKQCNGATAAVTDILQIGNYQSFRALDNTGRFIILMDRTHKLVSSAGVGGATLLFAEQQMPRIWNKTVSIPLLFDNAFADGRLTTIKTNNIGVLFISQGGFAEFDSQMRLRFTDK